MIVHHVSNTPMIIDSTHAVTRDGLSCKCDQSMTTDSSRDLICSPPNRLCTQRIHIVEQCSSAEDPFSPACTYELWSNKWGKHCSRISSSRKSGMSNQQRGSTHIWESPVRNLRMHGTNRLDIVRMTLPSELMIFVSESTTASHANVSHSEAQRLGCQALSDSAHVYDGNFAVSLGVFRSLHYLIWSRVADSRSEPGCCTGQRSVRIFSYRELFLRNRTNEENTHQKRDDGKPLCLHLASETSLTHVTGHCLEILRSPTACQVDVTPYPVYGRTVRETAV